MSPRLDLSIAEGLPLLLEELSAIANTGSIDYIMVLTVLKTRYGCQMEGPNIIYRVIVCDALTALTDRGPSTWYPPFDKGPVV